MIFADFTETGLIFVPSKDGISHTPEEWTDYAQLQKGIEVASVNCTIDGSKRKKQQHRNVLKHY